MENGSSHSVVLQVSSERIAFPLSNVVEVLQMVAVERLPDAPAHCRGWFDFHGQPVVVLDLDRRLGIPRSNRPEDSWALVVTRVAQGLLAFSVDEVRGVGNGGLPPPNFMPTEPITRSLLKGFVDDGGWSVPVVEPEALVAAGARLSIRELLSQLRGHRWEPL